MDEITSISNGIENIILKDMTDDEIIQAVRNVLINAFGDAYNPNGDTYMRFIDELSKMLIQVKTKINQTSTTTTD